MEPITREEMFLAKAGGQEVTTPKPITRIERFLQAIVDRIDGGSGGGSSGGAVSSVNGKTGAVELAYEDLKDKPFYESESGGDTITWDGNTEGLTCAITQNPETGEYENASFCKISNSAPKLEDFINGVLMKFYFFDPDPVEYMLQEFQYEAIVEMSEMFGNGCVVGWKLAFVSVPSDNFSVDILTFPEKGFYINTDVDPYCFVKFVKINGYSGFPSVKKMETKFLPSTSYETLSDKPFGKEYTDGIVLEETNLVIEENWFGYIYEGFTMPVIGEMYSVIVDGVKYDCRCLGECGYLHLLNTDTIELRFHNKESSGEGKPKIEVERKDNNEGSREVSISVIGPVEVIKTLDSQYLPMDSIIAAVKQSFTDVSQEGA